MTLKRAISALLLLFAAGSLIFVLVSDYPAAGRIEAGEGAPESMTPEVAVYYMDMGKDCTTCLNLEHYTREALETWFAEDLASGRIRWRTADLDDPANAHYLDEFKLYTKSVVLVRYEKGEQRRFDSLSRIWELVYDKDAYQKYIRDEVQSFLDHVEAPE